MNNISGHISQGNQLIMAMNSKAKRYENLVRAYTDDLFRYSFWLCGNRELAEDLVQETFLRAWRFLDSLQSESKAKAWLITILHRERARMYAKKRLDIVNIEQIPLGDYVKIDQETERHELQRAIAKLSIEYREPILLQLLAGFNSQEIADTLELNVNTVNTRLFRARKQLAELFKVGSTHQEASNG